MSGVNLLHLHIPKTAGTSLRSAFAHSKHNVLQVKPDFVYDPQRHADVDLFSGHVGFRVVEASPALRDRVVTILRDPYDRVVSYYYHLAKLNADGIERSARTNLAAKYPLHEFLAIKDHPHLVNDLYNAVTWQLAWDSDLQSRMSYRQQHAAFTESELVERAQASLRTFLVVGIQTRMSEFAARLKRATGFAERLPLENANPARAALSTVDAETRRRARPWIEMDIEVYEWALAHLDRA